MDAMVDMHRAHPRMRCQRGKEDGGVNSAAEGYNQRDIGEAWQQLCQACE